MKKIIICISIWVALGGFTSCDDFFETENRQIISDKDAFSSADGVNSVLGNLYSRMWDTQGFSAGMMNDWDESSNGAGEKSSTDYGNGYRRYWDYGLIREVNLFLQNLEAYGGSILPEKREYFEAEARFIRAWIYFDLVKNMGGVPLVLEPFEYTVGSKPESYQVPRSKETEIYDFIASEIDDIKDKMDVRVGNTAVKNRATKGAALALKSRAMLYAASIAKYTALRTDLVLSLPGGEVGIPASRASEYYQKSLDASVELMNMHLYRLYSSNTDRVDNFYEALTKKNAVNPEVIFVRDYDGENVKNGFTGATIPRSLRSGTGGGAEVNPTLNLVESYEMLDGSVQPLKTRTGGEKIDNLSDMEISDDYVIYDNPGNIFEGRDPRLFGTILTPGSKFKGADLLLWAGLAVWNGKGYTIRQVENIEDLQSDQDSKKYYEGRIMTGLDGPHATSGNITRTGFLLRKYVDNKGGADISSQSDIAWVRFRYAEILLNAAEAAYELGKTGDALKYINEIRLRAGGEDFLLSELTSIEQIRHERHVELAFEDHRFNDVRRWRVADRLFDGNTNTQTSVVYGLWPYQIYRPGHESDGKYIFRRVVAPKRLKPNYFINGNYYTGIDDDVLSNNKLLIKNPYQP